MELSKLLKQWLLEGLEKADLLETDFFQLREINTDPLHSYRYEKVDHPNYTETYHFDDRCGNTIVAVYIDSISEFKTGYRVEGVDSLIFQPERLDNAEELIKACPDDRKVATVYKILIEEIVPRYLLNNTPSKLYFNPVSKSRERLVNMILSKIIKTYPQLIKKNGYLINK